ncbi:hypothetical protein K490DRAFT_65228 [Saccharata proteae CBS 121410]|uniref:C3H1-type domain-containing protein n=1 Tax=Saccharata proteae CBS 121410 TaxID=1314787 RepID=A0A9P4HWA8_9PEZI|nr:hypothetical protein K490DRAFT_65228 [Saccharata proteae CBS 121410]
MADTPVSQRAQSGEPSLQDLVAMFRAQHENVQRTQQENFGDLLSQYEYVGGLLMRQDRVNGAYRERIEALEAEVQNLKVQEQRMSPLSKVARHLLQETQERYELIQKQGFVAVLIDGDGLCIGPEHRHFQTELLRKGTFGGEKAAKILQSGFLQKVRVDRPEIDDESKIRIAIYGNLRDLGDICWREGIVSDPGIVKDFARGFSSPRIHCDFIDVGPGCTAAKVIELFKSYRGNSLCRQMYYGTSGDRGWSHLFRHITPTDDLSLINLIEGPKLENGDFPLKIVKWEDLLRTTKTDSPADKRSLDPFAAPFRPIGTQERPFAKPSGDDPRVTDSMSASVSGSPSEFYKLTKGDNAATPSPIGAERGTNETKSQSGTPTQQSFPSLPPLGSGSFFDPRKTIGVGTEKEKKKLVLTTLRRPVSSEHVASPTQEEGSGSGVPSWAGAAKRGLQAPLLEPFPKAPITPPPAAIKNTIPRNRHGQRIDPALPNFNKEEIDRVKKIKMCNVHFLRGPCSYGPACKRNHEYKASKSELESLRHVARMACCVHGTACDDPLCIFGHRCPFPVLPNANKTGKNCMFGESCKFPADMHSMDLNQVYTTVVR